MLLAALAGCAGGSGGDGAAAGLNEIATAATPETFDYFEMFVNLADNVIIRNYEQLDTSLDALAGDEMGAVATYCAAIGTPDEAQALADARTAWRDGMAALRIAETLSPDHDSNDPRVLEALFMSLAETATFPEARRLALRAAKLLREAGENEWAADVERYAEAFARGESVRSGQ